MVYYLLEEDKLIGHKIIEDIFLFRKKLSLKGVYYNEFMKDIVSYLEGFPSNFIYDTLSGFIRTEKTKNVIHYLSFRDGGNGIGKTDLEKRINLLQYKFTDSYLKKALKVIEEIKESKN